MSEAALKDAQKLGSSILSKNLNQYFQENKPSLSQVTVQIIKTIHDFNILKSRNIKKKDEKLIINNMSEEQIWEQLNSHFVEMEKSHQKYFAKFSQLQQQQQQQKQQTSDSSSIDTQEKVKPNEGQNNASNDQPDSNTSSVENYDEELSQDIKSQHDWDEESSNNNQDLQKNKKQQNNKANAPAKSKEQELIDDEKELDEMEKFLEQQELEGKNKLMDYDDQEDDDEEEDDIDQFGDGEDESESENQQLKKKKSKKQKDDKSSEIGSDYEFSSNEQEEGVKAEDFFSKSIQKGGKKLSGEEEIEEEVNEQEDDDDIENQVFEEQREQQLKQTEEVAAAGNDQIIDNDNVSEDDEITRLEQNLVKNQKWQLKGEVKAKDRPVNSLIDEMLDFKKNLKPTQEITQDYTENLEKIIKQRILDEAFDDRIRHRLEEIQNNGLLQVSQEKSSKGLAELYEDEFKASLNLPQASKEDKLKIEIQQMLSELSYKLDSLSNLAFTPRHCLSNSVAEIKSTAPKVDFEQSIPLISGGEVGASVAQLSQQDNIFGQKQPDKQFTTKDAQFKSKEEMDHTENKAARRAKKRALRTRMKEKLQQKMLKGLKFKGQTKFEYNQINKAKQKAKQISENKNQKSVKFTKSGEFFKNLQNNLTNVEQVKGQNKQSKKIKKQNKINSKNTAQ